jgi:hypothetical protein
MFAARRWFRALVGPSATMTAYFETSLVPE